MNNSKIVSIIKSPSLNLGIFLKEFLLFSASTVFYQGSRFVVSLVVASRLGPEVFGLWNALSLILTYGGVVSLGIISAMNRDVPLFQGKGDVKKVEEIRYVSWGCTLCSSVVCGMILFIMPTFIPLTFSMKTYLQWMGLLFVADQLYSYFQAYLKSDRRFELMSYQQFIVAGILPIVVIPLVIVYALQGYIFGQAVVILAVSLVIVKFIPFTFRVTFDLQETFRLVKVGFPLMAVGMLYGLLTTVDRWVILTFLGVRELGYYSLAIMITAFLSIIPGVISQQVYPRMAETFGSTSSYSSLKKWLTCQTIMALAVMVPIVIGVYFLLPTFIERFLPKYVPGITAAKIVLFGVLFLPLVGGVGNLLNVVDKQVYYMAVQGFVILINLGLNIALVKMGLGIEGVALGTALTYFLYSLMLSTVGLVILKRNSNEERR